MHKKYHEKFKISGILAVTTQAREGIETVVELTSDANMESNNSSPRGH